MSGRWIRVIMVCASAALLAGCLSIHVDKTEKTTHTEEADSAK